MNNKNNYISIYFKDSRDMSELKNYSVQLIVTSPPYYIARETEKYRRYDEYLSDMFEIFKECFRVLENGCYICIVVSDYIHKDVKYPIQFDIANILKDIGYVYKECIIWKKPVGMKNITGGRRFGVFIQHPYPYNYHPNLNIEYILIYNKKGERSYVSDKIKEESKLVYTKFKQFNSSIWEISPVPGNKTNRHILEYPITIPKTLIHLYSYVNDTVLDPFLGSGTTALAALQLNRKAVGYEINNIYKDIIYNKLNKYISLKKLSDNYEN